MFTQSLILFGERNSKPLRTKMFVRNDMLSLVYTLAKCLRKMLWAITESRNTRGQTIQSTFHTARRKSLGFPSSEKQKASGKEERVCRIFMSVYHESDDNMNTLALSTFICCDCPTLTRCMRMLFIHTTQCGLMELLIGKFSDKHSTGNVLKLKEQKNYLISPWRHLFFSFENFKKKLFWVH